MMVTAARSLTRALVRGGWSPARGCGCAVKSTPSRRVEGISPRSAGDKLPAWHRPPGKGGGGAGRRGPNGVQRGRSERGPPGDAGRGRRGAGHSRNLAIFSPRQAGRRKAAAGPVRGADRPATRPWQNAEGDEAAPGCISATIPERRYYDLPGEILAQAVAEDPTNARSTALRLAEQGGATICRHRGGGGPAAVLLDSMGSRTGRRRRADPGLRNCPFHQLAVEQTEPA